MSKHLKMIVSYKGGPRIEEVLESGVSYDRLGSAFTVFSALYGDGTDKYDDVTRVVQQWAGSEWPDDWEERLYATRKPRVVTSGVGGLQLQSSDVPWVGFDKTVFSKAVVSTKADDYVATDGLVIHKASYGVPYKEEAVDVTQQVRSLVKNDSLDIIVNNSTLVPGQNPFRGQKKSLWVTYSYDGGESVTVERAEKDWLIIGQASQPMGQPTPIETPLRVDTNMDDPLPMSAPALNDYLIRKFSVSPQRLRGPMPIELRDFHRNDLAQLFAELGFKRGAEIGVAEGNYSEVLLKVNPTCELLLVDPWHAYSENPQNKTKEKHIYAFNEACRKTDGFAGRRLIMQYSMTAVKDVADDSLDFCYIDGNHLFDFVMQDLIEWSKRVRSGGIVSGDDYYALDQKRWVGGGVVEAVQAYVNAHRIPIWFTFSGHKSYDYMWVKP